MSIKSLHIFFVLLTFLSFSLRGIWMIRELDLLKNKWVGIFPHIIDTCLLISGLALALMYYGAFYTQSWLMAKILALFLYIVAGGFALKYGKTKKIRVFSLMVAWLIFIYIAIVAKTKLPIPIILDEK